MATIAPNMRDELARCACELFARHGINNVSLDAIAAKAGVTKGSLYWHYDSRRELILAAASQYYRDWQRLAHAEIASTGDPLEQIRRVWRMAVRMCLFDRSKRVFSTEIFALSLHDSQIRASWAQFYDTVRELFTGLIQAAANAGQIQVADPRETADWTLATFEGLKQRASFESEPCTEQQADRVVEGLMRILDASSNQKR